MSGRETDFWIPRPRSERATNYNPGRWVCSRQSGKCDGFFRVYGQKMKCPLWDKCREDLKNNYEWAYGKKTNGRFIGCGDPERNEEHWYRGHVLRRVFNPEHEKEEKRKYKMRHREEINQKKRERRARNRKESKVKEKKVILPCGEDCENCPYPVCQYTDIDDDNTEKAEQKKKKAEAQKRWREKKRSQQARPEDNIKIKEEKDHG